jgi:hypothetical protein
MDLQNWLIFDERSECYWGPNRRGYFKSIADAGLYTETEAKAAEDFARRFGRHEVARSLSEFRDPILRLSVALEDGFRLCTRCGCATVGTWPSNDLRRAFVAGAQWWEYTSQGATMWGTDRNKAEDEAERRYPNGVAPSPARDAKEEEAP